MSEHVVSQIALLLASKEVPFPTREQANEMKIPADIPVGALWRAQVAEAARRKVETVKQMLDEVTPMEDATSDGKEYKFIYTTVEGFEMQSQAQRVKVLFRGRPMKRSQDGREHAFTPRLDSKFSASGRLLARKARELQGHRVMAVLHYEPKSDGSGESVRILVDLVDRGKATEEDFQPRQARG